MKYSITDGFLSIEKYKILVDNLGGIFKDSVFYRCGYQTGDSIVDFVFSDLEFKGPFLFAELYKIEPGDALPHMHTDYKKVWVEPQQYQGWKPYDLNCNDFLNGKEGLIPVIRKATGILYLTDGEEGGTNLYDDNKALIETVRPKQNRLLWFEVNENSWHCPEESSVPQSRIIFWANELPHSPKSLDEGL